MPLHALSTSSRGFLLHIANCSGQLAFALILIRRILASSASSICPLWSDRRFPVSPFLEIVLTGGSSNHPIGNPLMPFWFLERTLTGTGPDILGLRY